MVGSALIALGCVLFAILSYEPANVVTFFGVGDGMSEGAVVIAGLLVILGCIASGMALVGVKAAAAGLIRRARASGRSASA
jgi:hypothetical protein